MNDRIQLLGLPLDPVDLGGALDWAGARLSGGEPAQIVTLNPELVVRSRRDAKLRLAISAAELVTADGVGIVWAARRLCNLELPGRVTGVDLTTALLEHFGERLRVFFLGGKPGVAATAAARAASLWNTTVAGVQHGYFDDEEAVVRAVRASGADLLLAGLGERQETFLHRHKQELGVPLSIGVGGTLDVLSGRVRRMPAWSQRLGLEWLLRVGGDPKRWPRALRLARFVLLVEAARRRGGCCGR